MANQYDFFNLMKAGGYNPMDGGITTNQMQDFRLQGLINNNKALDQKINALNLPPVQEPNPQEELVKKQRRANMLMAIGDAFKGKDIASGVMERQAMFNAQKERAERQAAYDKQYNLLNDNQKRMVDQQRVGINLPTATQRKIIKGADGFNYYADTGERVLPGVVTSPKIEDRKTIEGADGYKYYMDGTRVLPNVIGKENKSDRKYEKAADGFYRYIDDGKKVFGDVEVVDPNFIKPTEDNPMGLNKKERFDRSDKLSDDFRAGSKDFIVSRDSMKRILDAANDPSPFGDLSIIFSAMKVLDPNSVVRESEFKTVADAAPLLVRLGFSRDKVEAMTAGNKLTDTQRADVVGTVLKFYNSATSSQNELQDFYAKRATQSGLKPEDVIFDYGATVVPKIEAFNFIQNLQTMSKDQLTQLDRSEFTEKQKELFLKELKKRN
jgi:hypothetical protein